MIELPAAPCPRRPAAIDPRASVKAVQPSAGKRDYVSSISETVDSSASMRSLRRSAFGVVLSVFGFSTSAPRRLGVDASTADVRRAPSTLLAAPKPIILSY